MGFEMNTEIIESKNYRKQTYNICFDGREYFLMATNSIGIPEVMTYHTTLEEASEAFDQLPGKRKKLL